MLNNVVCDLGKVVNEQKVKNPGVTICYHTMKLDETDPKHFECTQTHKISFIPNADQDEKHVSYNSIAIKEDLKHWESDVIQLLWVVRWTAKGLMCVKPAIFLKGELAIPPGRACLVSNCE